MRVGEELSLIILTGLATYTVELATEPMLSNIKVGYIGYRIIY